MNSGLPTRSNTISLPLARPTRLGPDTHPWFWNPRNASADPAPAWFAARLRGIDPDLQIVRNRVTSKWQLWVREPRVQHPLCQGWKLLFVHHDRHGHPLPLDERLFARLYTISAEKWGSGKAYLQRVISEYERDREDRARQYRQDTIDAAMPSWDFSQIKVSGCGPSNGSKFSTYFA